MFRCNHHHQAAHYMSLLKLQCSNSQLKYTGVVNLVVWLHILGPCRCMSATLFGTWFRTVQQTYTNKDLIYAATPPTYFKGLF